MSTRPTRVVGHVTPWVEYADALEQEVRELRAELAAVTAPPSEPVIYTNEQLEKMQ